MTHHVGLYQVKRKIGHIAERFFPGNRPLFKWCDDCWQVLDYADVYNGDSQGSLKS